MRRREYLFRRIWRIVSFHLTWLDVRAGREYFQRKESKFMLNKYINADNYLTLFVVNVHFEDKFSNTNIAYTRVTILP